VAGLILSIDPSLSAFDVESIMQRSCVDMGPAGYDTDFGWGQVNANNALDPFNYAEDCDDNGMPDVCELSCVPEGCDAFACGTAEDCNANIIPDDCDLTAGTSADCNANNIPDECDLSAGTSLDCNLDERPDECGVVGSCEVEKIARTQASLFGWSAASTGDLTLIGAPSTTCAGGSTCGAVEVHRFTGGGWVQVDELTASDASAFDSFGISLAVDGDVAVVGAFGDSCGGGDNCGAAYVFRYDGVNWNEEQKLTATSRAAAAYFGGSVAVDAEADVVAVGAYGESCAAGANCGAVYVYRYSGGSWQLDDRLTASGAAAGDRFGGAVSISGFRLFAGADGDDCPGGGDCGAAYYFLYWNNAWGQEQTLTALDGFGLSVIVDGVQAIVGAPLETCSAGANCGAAYAYRAINGVWVPERKFMAETPVASDFFGNALGFRDGLLATAGYGASCPGGPFCGSAYVYRNRGTGWALEAFLTASDAGAFTQMGLSAAIGPANTILVGAYGAAYGFVVGGPDCDCNAALDLCDIVDGAVDDGNGNGVPDTCELAPPLAAPYPHNRLKNRYVSFDPNKAANGASTVAFEIELLSIEQGSCSANGAPCRYAQGTGQNEPGNNDCRICDVNGQPCISAATDCLPNTQACVLSGQSCANDAPTIGGSNVGTVWWVGPESPAADGRFLAVSEAFREERLGNDWPDVIHVGDCEIVPQASYGIRAVDVSSGTESDALVVSTIPRPADGVFAWWADAVGSVSGFCNNGDTTAAPCDPIDGGACGGNPGECLLAWTEPNGFTNFDDVISALAVFTATGGTPLAPRPAGVPINPAVPDITWVDVHGDNAGSASVDPPQSVANFADIGAMVLAFTGRPYPYTDPADCPDVDTWP